MSFQFRAKPTKKTTLEQTPQMKKIEKFCEEHNAEFIKRGEHYHEMEFYDAVKQNPSKHLKRISGLYRVILPNKSLSENGTFDQALTYYMQQECVKFSGEPIQIDKMEGVYQVPNTRDNKNLAGQTSRTEMRGTIPVYELEFNAENVQKVLALTPYAVQDFYIATGTTAGPDVIMNPLVIKNLDDFINGNPQELIDMNMFNYTTKEPCLDRWRKEQKEVKSNTQLIKSVTAAANNSRNVRNA